MDRFVQRLDDAKKAIDEADYVLIGAGAGLSTAAGIDYGYDRFKVYFEDFIEKYGFKDMYTSGFYPFETQEEKWLTGQDTLMPTDTVLEKQMYIRNY